MKKNIIIFSSMTPDNEMVEDIAPFIKKKEIGYIPAGYWDDGVKSAEAYAYKRMGFDYYIPFPIGKYYNSDKLDSLYKCDAIHLGGGNTFEFLFMLQHRNLLDFLRKYVAKGGLLMGTSAGGIMMCEKIRIAQFADENFLFMEGDELNSLGFVNFEVKPHWDVWEPFTPMFQQYVNTHGKDLYCLREGQAIFVRGNNMKFYGGEPFKVVPNVQETHDSN